MNRKVVTTKLTLEDGKAVDVRVMDGLLIEDLLIQGMKAEGYRVITGEDAFPEIDRTTKDYLIKTGVIS